MTMRTVICTIASIATLVSSVGQGIWYDAIGNGGSSGTALTNISDATGGVAVTGDVGTSTVISALHYGAEADGVTDDTAALQAAIDATPSGGILHVPSGVYVFSSLTITNPITVFGDGWRVNNSGLFGASNWTNSNCSGTLLRSTATSGIALNCNGVSAWNYNLRDIAIIGPGSGTSTGLSMATPSEANAVVHSRFERVLVANFSVGAYMGFCINNTFSGLQIIGCTTGLELGPSSNANSFYDLNVDFVGTAVTLTNNAGNAFYRPLIQNVYTNGVGFRFEETSANNNNVQTIDAGWFEFGTATNVAAVYINAGKNIAVRNCEIPSGAHIAVVKGTDHKLIFNRFTNPGTNILISATATNTLVGWNQLSDGLTTGVIADSGVTTSVIEPDGDMLVSGNLQIGLPGSGAFYLWNGTTAGNARGANAVDLQTDRSDPAMAATGISSVVIGGHDNRAASSYSTSLGGYNNQANNQFATVMGRDALASGVYSSAAGGYATAYLYGQSSRASGKFSAQADAQQSFLTSRITTTDSTSNMAIDGASALCVIPANTTWAFEITIVARSTDGGTGAEESAAYKYVGCIERDGANNTAIVGSVTETVIAEDDADWSVVVTADDINEALNIAVTSDDANTVRWVAKIELVEVGG